MKDSVTTKTTKLTTLTEDQTLVIKVGKFEYQMPYEDVAFLILNKIVDDLRPTKPVKVRQSARLET